MAFFKKKEKKEEIPVLKEQEEVRKLLEKYKEEAEHKVAPQESGEFSLETKEYKEFKGDIEKSKKPGSFYEKAGEFAGRHLQINVNEKQKQKLDETLYYINFATHAENVYSLAVLIIIISTIISASLILFSFNLALYSLVLGVMAGVGVIMYPNYKKKLEDMDTMNNMPLAITYIVIYLRTTPTLEGAVRFAATHIGGSLGRDLREMLWKLENGIYYNMDDALKRYSAKWYDKNRDFSTAIEIIRNSEKVSDGGKRIKILDQATTTVLEGNMTMMKGFAMSLKMPIIVLYMLCVVLPVMGLVIAPVMTTLMSGGMGLKPLILTYDIILPIVVYLFIKGIMSKRPGAFSMTKIENVPGIAKPGHYLLKTKDKEYNIPLLPVSILVFFLISIPGITMLLNYGGELVYSMLNIIRSMTIIWGATAAIGIYTIGGSIQKLKVRKDLQNLENDLDIALYQISNKMAMGVPLENAFKSSAENIEKGPMKELMEKTIRNMESMAMSFEAALFDPREGALVRYPSRLVRTVMEVVIESRKKGLDSASASLAAIGIYLKNLKNIKKDIQEIIGGTLSSMKFQAQFLTSFIAGVVISLNILLAKIMISLGGDMKNLSVGGVLGGEGGMTGVFQNSMFDISSAVPAEHMQLVVGVYAIGVTVLLSLLVNGVENGRDDIYRDMTLGKNLITSIVVYTVSMLFGVLMFSNMSI